MNDAMVLTFLSDLGFLDAGSAEDAERLVDFEPVESVSCERVAAVLRFGGISAVVG
jgi:hypothetical protein